VRYRVDDLAGRTRVSVDTIRFYQTQGLLPPPVREGRAAWYSQGHLDRIRRIRDLKNKGFTLGSIRRLLDAELDPADEALVEAVAGEIGSEKEEFLSLEELAERVGVSPALVQAIARERLLVPRTVNGEDVYTSADVAAASAGLALLEAGLPLSDLLELAHEYDESARLIAERAVEMFDRFVREPIRGSTEDDEEAAERLVASFRKMLPATVALVAHHFRRVLISTAQTRIEQIGEPSEIDAVHSEAAKNLEPSWPV